MACVLPAPSPGMHSVRTAASLTQCCVVFPPDVWCFLLVCLLSEIGTSLGSVFGLFWRAGQHLLQRLAGFGERMGAVGCTIRQGPSAAGLMSFGVPLDLPGFP